MPVVYQRSCVDNRVRLPLTRPLRSLETSVEHSSNGPAEYYFFLGDLPNQLFYCSCADSRQTESCRQPSSIRQHRRTGASSSSQGCQSSRSEGHLVVGGYKYTSAAEAAVAGRGATGVAKRRASGGVRRGRPSGVGSEPPLHWTEGATLRCRILVGWLVTHLAIRWQPRGQTYGSDLRVLPSRNTSAS